jgi:FAD binding domain-containing protein/berberine-like enzyme
LSPLKKIKRHEFIKLSLLSSAGVYFDSCGMGNKKQQKIAKEESGTIPKDSILKKPVEKIIQPTFELYKKGDAEYDILRKGFNKRINKYPAAIALCKTTEEAAQAVSYGIQNQLAISIKSGGHSFEGFSCNNDGLVIDLSSMNNVTWDNENTVIVEPGCKLSQLYDIILPKNKILPAGSCGNVGIGGLTLGGGYGLFSRKIGLTCDSLQEITMVDGTGNIINSKDDPELLWACKGGGNGNFGVITSLKFTLNKAPDFLQSHRFKINQIDVKRAKDMMEKWFSITANLPHSCFSAFVLNGRSLYILLTNCEKQNDDTQAIISQLSALTDKTISGKALPLEKAVKVFYGEKKPIYFKNASAGLYKNFADISGCIENVLQKVTSTPDMIYQVNTLGGKIDDADFAKASSYSHRGQNYLSELQTYWRQESQTDKMIKSFEEVQQIFHANGIKQQYRNYPDINLINWESAYYGENYNRLQKVKNKYDGRNIFRYEQSIAPSAP